MPTECSGGRGETNVSKRRTGSNTLDPILSLQTGRGGNVHRKDNGEDGHAAFHPDTIQSAVSSLCFLNTNMESSSISSSSTSEVPSNIDKSRRYAEAGDESSCSSDDDDDDEDYPLFFKSRQLELSASSFCSPGNKYPFSDANATRARLEWLRGKILASAHSDGQALLWDLGLGGATRPIANIVSAVDRRGPGLSVQRVFLNGGRSNDDDDDDYGCLSQRLLYHTRDPLGIVSLHDTNVLRSSSVTTVSGHPNQWPHHHHNNSSSSSNNSSNTSNGVADQGGLATIAQFQTSGRGFCAAAACRGDGNLVALPCGTSAATSTTSSSSGSSSLISTSMILDSMVVVRDWRVPPHDHPVALFHGSGRIVPSSSSNDPSGNSNSSSNSNTLDKVVNSASRAQSCGMLTSLAMTTTTGGGGSRSIVACGMENGELFLHDLAMLTSANTTAVAAAATTAATTTSTTTTTGYSYTTDAVTATSSISLGADAILTVDVHPSNERRDISGIQNKDTHTQQSKTTRDYCYSKNDPDSCFSVVAIAGMAGETVEERNLPEHERGRIAVVKATSTTNHTTTCPCRHCTMKCSSSSPPQIPQMDDTNNHHHHPNKFVTRLRTRFGTCRIPTEDAALSGKPGVGVCRFRPDGRIFAAGGWDKRVRIFDRSTTSSNSATGTSSPLAVLRGHETSVNAIDWDMNAKRNGLLATGSQDGAIHIWRCFASD